MNCLKAVRKKDGFWVNFSWEITYEKLNEKENNEKDNNR